MKVNKERKCFNLNSKIIDKLYALIYYYEESESRTIEKCIETQYNILKMKDKEAFESAITRAYTEINYDRGIKRNVSSRN